MTEESVGKVLRHLFAEFERAEAENRLAGYVDDRMLELQENDPVLYALTQHLISGVPDNCDANGACHQLFVLAYTIYKAGSEDGAGGSGAGVAAKS